MAERHATSLAELAELGMGLARDLQRRALEATDDAVAADLTLAFHRTSRSVRQTYALEARLERERRQAEREHLSRQANEARDRVFRKRRQVRHALTRLIWTEYEAEDAEAWTEALDQRLSFDLLPEDFGDAPLDACIERIRADLGLPAANDPDGGPKGGPTGDGGDDGETAPREPVEVTIWRSSA